jgi:hypothetical protein
MERLAMYHWQTIDRKVIVEAVDDGEAYIHAADFDSDIDDVIWYHGGYVSLDSLTFLDEPPISEPEAQAAEVNEVNVKFGWQDEMTCPKCGHSGYNPGGGYSFVGGQCGHTFTDAEWGAMTEKATLTFTPEQRSDALQAQIKRDFDSIPEEPL